MKRTILGLVLTLAVTIPAWSQPPQAPQPPAGAQAPADSTAEDTGEAPDRGVARLSIIQGNVSVRRGDSGEMVAAAVNAPVVAEDRLITGEGARAEVQFDASNMIRLSPLTEVRFSELQDRRYQVQIASGLVTFRVLSANQALVEISTPNVSVRPMKPGVYRIEVRPDGTSQVTVREGTAEIFSPKGTEQLQAGQTMDARGSASDPEFQIVAAIAPDEWDRWNADRDRDLQRSSISRKYVPPDVYGTEELDAHGTWETDGQYGNVWVPRVDADWAPYRVGRWAWEDYYGWTWISGDPWGWAPYHYGRWYQGSRGWAWWPGAYGGRHYWRPALVGFFGWGGGGIGVGFGFGNVGWVPLAPYERFHPWYGRGFNSNYRNGSFNRTTIIRNTNITNVYRNARGGNGVSGMAAGNFGRGGVNTRNVVRPNSGDLSRAGAVRGQVGLAPSRDSQRFTDRNVSTAGMPRSNYNGSFVSRNSAANSQGNSQRQGVGNTRPGGFNTPQGGSDRGNQGGWQRFNPGQGGAGQGGQNAGQNRMGQGSPRGPSTGAPQRDSSWQRFNPGQGGPGQQGSQRQSAPPARGGSQGPDRGTSMRPQGPSGGGGGSYDRPSAPYNRPSAPPPAGGGYSGPSNRGANQQPVRISPPMVRSNPGGGGGYSPRQNQAPSGPRAAPAPRSAPPQRSAPAPRSGGGNQHNNSGGQRGGRNR